jgi:hypothetical protein
MFHGDSIVHHLLEVLKGMHQYLISDRAIQAIPVVVMLLLIVGYFCWRIT